MVAYPTRYNEFGRVKFHAGGTSMDEICRVNGGTLHPSRCPRCNSGTSSYYLHLLTTLDKKVASK